MIDLEKGIFSIELWVNLSRKLKLTKPISRLIQELIPGLFILLFVYAATSKLLDFQTFSVQLGQSPLLTAFAEWVAWIIPIIELLIAVLLVMPRFRLVALYGSFGLMVMFTTYIIAIIKFSDYIPCSCGGVLQNLSWNQHLVFNIGFVLIALIGIFSHRPSEKNTFPSV
jgi:uncharacterized membrane protein YphA (DoxX/SURF4 family)